MKKAIGLGLLVGAAYLPFTLQFLLAADYFGGSVQILTFILIPFCWSCYGIGTMFPGLPRKFRVEVLYGTAFLVFLASSLFIPINPVFKIALILRVLTMALPVALFYFYVGRQFSFYLERGRENPHYFYGLFVAGTIVGFILSDQALPWIGANGLLLFLGFGFYVSTWANRTLVIAPVLIILAVACSHLDSRAEQLRGHFSGLLESDDAHEKLKFFDHLGKQGDLRWTRRGQTFFSRAEDGSFEAAVVNLRVNFRLGQTLISRSARSTLFTNFTDQQDIVIVGAGAGRSLNFLQSNLLTKKIALVERDQGIVSLAQKANPLVSHVNYVNSDGRAFVEHSEKLWDWIVVESAMDQGNAASVTFLSPDSLYTKEALVMYRERLKPQGALVLEVNRLYDSRRKRQFEVIAKNLRGRENSEYKNLFLKIENGSGETTGLAITSKDSSLLDKIEANNSASVVRMRSGANSARWCSKRFSDNNPFFSLACSGRRLMSTLSGLIFLIAISLVASGAFFRKRLGIGFEQRRAQIFIFVQAAAQNLFFISLSFRLRTLHFDDASTLYLLVLISSFASAGASFLMYLTQQRQIVLKTPVVVSLVLICAAFIEFAIQFNLFHLPSAPLRVTIFVVSVGLLFLCTSLLFQIALNSSKNMSGTVWPAFFFSSLAVVPAYALCLALLIEADLTVIMWTGVFFYFSCLFLEPNNRKSLARKSLASESVYIL